MKGKVRSGRIDRDKVAEYERELRHDVMAHVHAYGDVAPKARGILHLGATSCFVADGSDLIMMKAGLEILRDRLVAVVRALAAFCEQEAAHPILGFTHFQPAQPTTLGKRAALWLQDGLHRAGGPPWTPEAWRRVIEIKFC